MSPFSPVNASFYYIVSVYAMRSKRPPSWRLPQLLLCAFPMLKVLSSVDVGVVLL